MLGSSGAELGRGESRTRGVITSGLLGGGVIFRGPRVLAGVAGETPRLLGLRGRVRVRVRIRVRVSVRVRVKV